MSEIAEPNPFCLFFAFLLFLASAHDRFSHERRNKGPENLRQPFSVLLQDAKDRVDSLQGVCANHSRPLLLCETRRPHRVKGQSKLPCSNPIASSTKPCTDVAASPPRT